MIAACRAANVAFMDGTMFVHHQRFKQVERLFADTTWQPKRVTSAFTFAAPIDFLAGGNIRTNGMDPLGCLGDVGWYCLRLRPGRVQITSPHTCGRASGRRRTAECLRTWTATSASAEAIPNARCSRRGS